MSEAALQSRTVEALAAAVQAGETPKYVFFWTHETHRPSEPGPWMFSQWFPAPFTADGHEFATSEHYMMWREELGQGQ